MSTLLRQYRGIVTLQCFDPVRGLLYPPYAITHNTRMYAWGFLACKALGQGDSAYALNCVYIEYANVASPGDTVSVPSFNRQDGLSYYTGLATDPIRDYLRIPLVSTPTIDVYPGYEAFFPAGQGNRLTITAQTGGTTGVNGKPFSHASNSTIYGVGIVAAPALNDPTQDILFARSYYAPSSQALKLENLDFVATYQTPFVSDQ